MIWIALLAATMPTFSAPEPIERWKWFRDYDMVSWLPSDHLYSTLVAVTVAPTGKPIDCVVEESSGDKRFDTRTCDIMKKRGRFKPAVGQDGKPAFGMFRGGNSVAIFDKAKQMPLPPAVNLALTVSRLPPGLGGTVWISVAYVTDPAGRAVDCKGRGETDDPTMVLLACKEITTNVTDRPIVDGSGHPVSAVRTMSFGFTAG